MSDAPMSEEQWREEIDRRLNAVRPARYHENDRAWMEPVIQWAEANIPPAVLAQALENERWRGGDC